MKFKLASRHCGAMVFANFDEAINRRFDFENDFSKEGMQKYLKRCNLDLNVPPEEILLSLSVAKKTNSSFQLMNAGVIFFAKDPQYFFPESYITAVRYKSNDRFSIIDRKDFSGSPLSQIEESLAFIIRHMNVSASFTDLGGVRQDIYDYPPIALREAIVNAITHRDYLYDASHIYIHMYPSYIDIENPGGLYHGITIEDLGRRSVRRNRLLADLLYRARYIERIGSGFDRMRIALAENNNPPLEVVATNFFNIRFFKRSEDPKLQKLTERQLAIYHCFLERRAVTKREIATSLQMSEDTIIRELKVLIELRLIKKQGQGKSTSYRHS